MARQRIPAAHLLSRRCPAHRSPCSSPAAATDGASAAASPHDDHRPPAPGDGRRSRSGISPERCEANKAAGTITYLSGFDFSASASIVEVIVAEQKGYFDEMCLDVELKPSFSTANYPLVAANEAQFASAGSYAEIADYDAANDAELVVVAHGRQDRHRRAHRQGGRGHHARPTSRARPSA